QRRRLVHALKTGARPGRRIALEHEGAHRGRMPVVVRVEESRVVLHEGLRQRLERLRRAEPGELVAERHDRGAEISSFSNDGVGTVRGAPEIEILQVFTPGK